MSGPPTLTTARLRLRAFVDADLEANLAMDLDPEVARYIWGTPPDPVAQRGKIADMIRGDWPPRGAVWCVEWHDRVGLTGWCGLFPLDGAPEEIELGYRFVPAVWGQGIATEAGACVRDWGFRVMGLGREVAVTHPDNRASQRVLAKLGFDRRGTGFHYGRELPLFVLDRAGWEAGRSPQA